MRPITSRYVNRRYVGILTVTVLAALATSACKSSTTANTAGGPAPTKVAGTASGPAPATTAPPAVTGGGSCTAAISTAVAALVTVPVGAPADPIPSANTNSLVYACMYGIGKNATLAASALPSATDDTVLVSVLGAGGAGEYANEVGYKFFPVSGVGDKAKYSFYADSGQAPDFHALKGDEECSVQINASDEPTELGVAAQGSAGGILPSGAATVAQKEGAICSAVFGG